MIDLAPQRIAELCRADLVAEGPGKRPERAVIDSREVRGGDLFAGLPGASADGSAFARQAIGAGAWGVLVTPEHARDLAGGDADAWIFAAPNPLRALQRLARGWRRELGATTIGITGSTGKTSTKDICRGLLPGRVHASPENYNTEIGLPLAILGADTGTQTLVLEMAMRGMGQIAELCEIAEPDVGAITNIGPVHLELLGTLEAIAEAKAEIFQGLGDRGVAVLPEDAEALEPHLHDTLRTVTFGAGGDVIALEVKVRDGRTHARVGTPDGEADFDLPFTEAYNLRNTLCAIAVGAAAGASVEEMAARAGEVSFSRLRGELVHMAGDVVVVNDCYNANPISMRAALDHLMTLEAPGRRIAVLGEMRELGPDAAAYHREIGAHARAIGVDAVVGVGLSARDYAPDSHAPDAAAAVEPVARMIDSGDRLLVKGSRGVGLEALTSALEKLRREGG